MLARFDKSRGCISCLTDMCVKYHQPSMIVTIDLRYRKASSHSNDNERRSGKPVNSCKTNITDQGFP